jgi:hypothetical protein
MKNPWAENAEATGIFQKSKFWNSASGDPGKQNKLMMFCPSLFSCKEAFQSATAYKDPVVWRPEMADAFKWMMARRDETTIACAKDARSTNIRMKFQEIVFETEK